MAENEARGAHAGATVNVDSGELSRTIASILSAGDMAGTDALTVADALVWAELRGVSSHGLAWLPRYLAMMERGEIDPRARLVVMRHSAAHFVLEAHRAAGAVAMMEAVRLAATCTQSSAVAIGGVRDMTHCGAIGQYAAALSAHGCAAIVAVAGPPLMAYHGARVASVSTSPLAIAVPRAHGDPLLLDMATSVVPFSRLREYRALGRSLPEGAAIDALGVATTNPQHAAVSLPIAGAKGAGLALMIEILASVLLDCPIVSEFLDDAGDHHHRQNALVIALQIDAFGPRERFVDAVETLVARMHALPRAAGFDEIRMPGERGARSAVDLERSGIPIPVQLWTEVAAIAAKRGVTMPAPLPRAT